LSPAQLKAAAKKHPPVPKVLDVYMRSMEKGGMGKGIDELAGWCCGEGGERERERGGGVNNITCVSAHSWRGGDGVEGKMEWR
jgi:hypothetical protein